MDTILPPLSAMPPGTLPRVLLAGATGTAGGAEFIQALGGVLDQAEADPADGRSVLVTLTEEGRTRVDAAITRLVDAEAVLLGVLSRSDRERLAGLLRKHADELADRAGAALDLVGIAVARNA